MGRAGASEAGRAERPYVWGVGRLENNAGGVAFIPPSLNKKKGAAAALNYHKRRGARGKEEGCADCACARRGRVRSARERGRERSRKRRFLPAPPPPLRTAHARLLASAFYAAVARSRYEPGESAARACAVGGRGEEEEGELCARASLTWAELRREDPPGCVC